MNRSFINNSRLSPWYDKNKGKGIYSLTPVLPIYYTGFGLEITLFLCPECGSRVGEE